MKISAVANSNIALVKYWGKRDQKLILPENSSQSMTVDALHSHVTVDFDEKYKKDIFVLNNKRFRKGADEYDKIILFLRLVRKIADTKMKAKIVGKNNFPTAAGLASSASGFASLAAAANKALSLNLDNRELSILARRGSGSATRSIFGGFVEWQKGKKKDGSDSYAKQIASFKYWPDFRMIACIVSDKKKSVSSRKGMQQSVLTSPMYRSWLESISKDLKKIRRGIKKRDFSLVGKTAEKNCLKMHSVMMTTEPPLIYWNSTTIKVMHSVIRWRKTGLECYFTIDAGPQVKIICLKKDVKEITKRCKRLEGIKDVVVMKPGRGVKITKKHLF